VQIVRNCYGEQVLDAAPLALEENRAYTLAARVEGDLIRVSIVDFFPAQAYRELRKAGRGKIS
jgi:hypothetical protein